MNDVMKFSGGGTGLMSRDDLTRSLNNVSAVAPRVGGEFQFLKMEKGTGEWLYGQEETVVEKDALWAVNPTSLEYGYIAWPPETASDREPEGEIMVSINRELPSVNTLRTKHPDGQTTGNGWQYQQSMVLVCINGEDEGVACQYKQSSVGSLKAFKSVTDAIGAQVAKGADEIVPIIRLKSDSYKHKKWGKIVNPIFEIVEWRTMDDTSPVEETPKEEAKPARTRASAAPTPPAEGSDAEDKALEAEYEAAAAEEKTEERAPRRRQRR